MSGPVTREGATAVCTPRFIHLETVSKGIADPRGRAVFLPADVPADELGEALLACMAASRAVMAAPRPELRPAAGTEYDPELFDHRKVAERHGAWVRRVQEQYGYRSREALFADLTMCSAFRDRGTATARLIPFRRIKGEQFEGIEGAELLVRTDGPAAGLGAALREGLRCPVPGAG